MNKNFVYGDENRSKCFVKETTNEGEFKVLVDDGFYERKGVFTTRRTQDNLGSKKEKQWARVINELYSF